tara:strand:+ start:347 stop:484 length:138 start_codon:yes stop_codon:yes gene_type:complete
MSRVEEYDNKARREVTMKKMQVQLMNGGSWKLKEISSKQSFYCLK